jgi:outer membrane lipoprotein-sorting protein
VVSYILEENIASTFKAVEGVTATMTREVTQSSETFVTTYAETWHHNPKTIIHIEL